VSGFSNDPLWNQPALSYNVVAMATPALQQAVAPVLDSLSQIAGEGALHLTPPEALHVSLYTVAPVRDRFDKERYWTGVQQAVRRIVVCAAGFALHPAPRHAGGDRCGG
jgi:hypothetical protein